MLIHTYMFTSIHLFEEPGENGKRERVKGKKKEGESEREKRIKDMSYGTSKNMVLNHSIT